MNKNTTIGLVVLLLVIGFGYYFSRHNEVLNNNTNVPDVTYSTNGTNTQNPIDSTQQPAQNSTPDAPKVETSQNSGVSASTASLTGKVNPNGASTTYWFDYGETTSFGSRSPSQAIGTGFTSISTPAFITGLKANTKYYYRLSAKNKFATVNGVTYNFTTNNTPAPTGSAPTTRTVVANNITRNTASINGQINPNNFETAYWFEYGSDQNLGFITGIQTVGAGNAQVAVSSALSGLQPLTKYYYRLNAQNQYGTVNGSVMSFTTQGPKAPSTPTVKTNQATSISANTAKLAGTINPNGVETTYWFEYSDDSLLSNLIGNGTAQKIIKAGTAPVTIQENLSGLQPSTNYYYRIVGKNSYGTVNGNIIPFTTTAR